MSAKQRKFGWSDMFLPEAEDPRVDGGWPNDERSVLLGQLADRRMTLRMKCEGLSADQMAQRSVPPSDLSLLGLVRHLASVEQYWFRSALAGEDIERLYQVDGEDLAFAVEPDDAMVGDAWSTWSDEVTNGAEYLDGVDDLGQLGVGRDIPVREVLVHLIREYAQHLGHADFLRECVDGRVGQ